MAPDSVSFSELAHPMYATGIGLVLYGIEQSELEQRGEQEPEEKMNDGKIDIFANMGSEPEPEKKKKKDKEKKKSGGDNFQSVIGRFFGQVFDEGIDD